MPACPRGSSWIGLLLLMLLSAGCSGLPEPRYPPNPLPDTEQSIQLESLWQDHAGSGHLARGYNLQPALLGRYLVTADPQGLVQAYDLEDRRWLRGPKRIWQRQLPAGVSASLLLTDSALYVPTQQGELLALNPLDGSLIWTARLPSEALSQPQAEGNRLVVQTGDGKLLSLDRQTGRQLWLYDSLMPALSLRGTATPTLTPLTTYTGFANGQVVAINNQTGQLRWNTQVALPSGRTDIERLIDMDGQPRLAGSLLLVNTYQGQTQALDQFTGRPRWSRDLSSYQAAVIYQNRLALIVDEASRIHALDVQSGTSLWMQEALYGRELTEPVLLDDLLLVADYQGYLHLLDPETGRLLGRQSFDLDGISTTPLVDQGRVLVHSVSGRIGLFRLKKD